MSESTPISKQVDELQDLLEELLGLPPAAWETALREDERFHDFLFLVVLQRESSRLQWSDPALAERLALAGLRLIDRLGTIHLLMDRQSGEELLRLMTWCNCADARRQGADLVGATLALTEAEPHVSGIPDGAGEVIYLHSLALLRIDQLRPMEAAELLRRAVERAGPGKMSKCASLLELGDLHWQLRSFDKAAGAWQQLLDTFKPPRLLGPFLRAVFLLSICHLELGQRDLARDLWSWALPQLPRERPFAEPSNYWAAARAASLLGGRLEETDELIRQGCAATLLTGGVWEAGRMLLDCAGAFGLPEQVPIVQATADLLLEWYEDKPARHEVARTLAAAFGALGSGEDLFLVLNRASLALRVARRDLEPMPVAQEATAGRVH